MRRPLPIFAALLALTSCDAVALLTGATSVVPGLLVTGAGETTITMPDSVARGVPFDVQFNSYGGSCIPDVARTEVMYVASDTVEIRPYDRQRTTGCGDAILTPLRHTVTVTLARPGRARIRIIGDKGAVIGNAARTHVIVERDVVAH
jgi:hypothetical protein